MLWLNLLHLYQPVNSDEHIIKEATEKSYLRIIRALEEYPNLHFTFNISGCLFLRWEDLGYFDLIKRLRKLIKKGQLELTGSAAYHPIMPLIPEKEAQRQIKTNEKILRKYFGQDFKPVGFFLPELAYSREVSRIIKRMGYKWIVLDEFSAYGKMGAIDFNKIYKDVASGLKIVFRSRRLSNSFVPEIILKLARAKKSEDKIIITATDGELYGLRHNDPTAEFEKSVKAKNVKTLTFSEFIALRKKTERISPIASSWETGKKDIKNKNPYSLWHNRKNKIQMKLWELANFAYKTVEAHRNDENYDWARWHLVRGLASCTFWWASRKDFRRVFGPISWSPDEIERGTNELIRAVRSLESSLTRKDKIKAEKLYIKAKQMVWEKHWIYYWKK